MLAKQLPAAIEAEESVLSTILCDSSGVAVERALELLEPQHFASPSAQAIFRAMRKTYEQGGLVDVLTVAAQLDRSHELEALKKPGRGQTAEQAGRTYLLELAADFPVLTRIPHHARLILDAWGKREAILAFDKPMEALWNGAGAAETLSAVEAVCQGLYARVMAGGEAQVVSGLDMATRAQERLLAGTPKGGVPPPFPFLDNLMPGRLYILGGVAKEGKTVIAGQAARVACQAKVPTGFATLEMAEPYLTDRLISGFGVPYGPLQRHVVADEFRDNWNHALLEMSTWPLQVLDNPAADVPEITRFQKLGRFGFLIIDHLHQIAYEAARDPRLRLSAVVKALAQLARTAKIPILLLAQLHRPPGTDSFPRPTMNSFKETSAIEQQASALWAIHRKRDESGKRLDEASFLVLADRYGTDGSWPLRFQGSFQRFSPVTRDG